MIKRLMLDARGKGRFQFLKRKTNFQQYALSDGIPAATHYSIASRTNRNGCRQTIQKATCSFWRYRTFETVRTDSPKYHKERKVCAHITKLLHSYLTVRPVNGGVK